MRCATWNVNSVRARLPRVLAWLERQRPDIVCLQEIKVVDADFPTSDIAALGYHSITFGQKTYNGVAILTHHEPTEIHKGLPDDDDGADKRLIGALIDGVWIYSVYAPNGGEVNSDKYAFKLDWYARLRRFLVETYSPNIPLALCGDFNVAPEDRDIWDPEQWRDKTLFSEPEKRVYGELVAWGLVDTLRKHHDEGGLFTWWDYRMGAFHRGWGLRIDHILASPAIAERCTGVEIDRNERKGEKPSDHAPVIATFASPP